MAITDAEITKLKGMCPAAADVDLGTLIRAAETGGLEAGDGIDITEGAVSVLVDDTTVEIGESGLQVKAGSIGADQIADSAVGTDQLADEAVTAAKLDPAIALVENPLAGGAAGEVLIRGKVTLAAASPTTVQIASASNQATLLGSVAAATRALTPGNTFIVNPNGAGNQTWTVAGTAGKSAGATSPSTDMSAETRHHIQVAVDGGAAQDVGFDWSAGGGCNTGNKIAAEMQTKIRALGGAYATVTVAYDTDHYDVTSGTLGTASRVVITPAADDDCTEELKLGVTGGGTETAGTGDAANLAAATPAEIAAKIASLHASLAQTVAEANKIRLKATGEAGSSSLVVGNGTENAALGFTNAQADYGDVGLGAAHAMADANYTVVLTPMGSAPGTNPRCISVHNLTTDSFDVYQENAAAIDCMVIVVGTPAA